MEHEGEDWESLEKVRLPLCLNLSQCKLELGEYQEVVDFNSKLLKKHKGELIYSFTAEINIGQLDKLFRLVLPVSHLIFIFKTGHTFLHVSYI